MSIIVFAESWGGKFKSTSFQAVSYAKEIANNKSQNLIAVSVNADNAEELYLYGADKVISVESESIKEKSVLHIAEILKSVAEANDASLVVSTSSFNTSYFAPALADKLEAALITNVNGLPTNFDTLTFPRSVFSGKGTAEVSPSEGKVIVLISANSFKESKVSESAGDVESKPDDIVASLPLSVLETKKSEGTISLGDADIVISAGRGLKDPSNWGIIEELAGELGAATACSKPVSDLGWRPHSEHVGQTGRKVSPVVYFAIGISGAVQHIAGINSSKFIVAINTDPEAPIFKVADYGIVGDAFEVVPKLIQKVKDMKQS